MIKKLLPFDKYIFCITIEIQKLRGELIMAISIRLNDEDEKILRAIVEANQTTLSVYVRTVLEEKIEE